MFDIKVDQAILDAASLPGVPAYNAAGKVVLEEAGDPALIVRQSANPHVLSDEDRAFVENSPVPVLLVGERQHPEFDNVKGWLPQQYMESAPYEGRPFLHGIFDCYTLIHDWMRREKGVILPTNVARQHGWWNNGGQSPYMQWFSKFGYKPVPMADTVGDVVIFSFGKLNAVHAGVLVAEDELLHHLSGSLSCRTSVTSLARHIHMVIRPPC